MEAKPTRVQRAIGRPSSSTRTKPEEQGTLVLVTRSIHFIHQQLKAPSNLQVVPVNNSQQEPSQQRPPRRKETMTNDLPVVLLR